MTRLESHGGRPGLILAIGELRSTDRALLRPDHETPTSA